MGGPNVDKCDVFLLNVALNSAQHSGRVAPTRHGRQREGRVTVFPMDADSYEKDTGELRWVVLSEIFTHRAFHLSKRDGTAQMGFTGESREAPGARVSGFSLRQVALKQKRLQRRFRLSEYGTPMCASRSVFRILGHGTQILLLRIPSGVFPITDLQWGAYRLVSDFTLYLSCWVCAPLQFTTL